MAHLDLVYMCVLLFSLILINLCCQFIRQVCWFLTINEHFLHLKKEIDPRELEAAVLCRLNPPAQGGHCDSPGLENSNTPVSIPYRKELALRSRSLWVSSTWVVHAIQLCVHSAAISKKFLPHVRQNVALGS